MKDNERNAIKKNSKLVDSYIASSDWIKKEKRNSKSKRL